MVLMNLGYGPVCLPALKALVFFCTSAHTSLYKPHAANRKPLAATESVAEGVRRLSGSVVSGHRSGNCERGGYLLSSIIGGWIGPRELGKSLLQNIKVSKYQSSSHLRI
ncbi:hypothetical protein F5B19DRAFT_451947 [Rostrohypoxylon terebratum]|nr:hypothetical protein F5B19DRAFT_451947 [Rostrohypoxylon terebratum]